MAIDVSESAISLFQSQDRLELLNDIDKFRKHGLANLPQIVVCGDTSSGKSSVLEALSGIPFPVDSTLCTRFATEIALRYTSEETVTGEAFISPGPRSSESHQLHLGSFHETITSLKAIPEILRNAQEAMGVGKTGGISRDVLHLRLRGRLLPNLTLVDLPGIIHAATDQDDIAKVQGLVEHYFKQEESLIMTVVSAENPIENQGILTVCQRFDPAGERSIGVITKPDILQRADKARMTPTVLELARNQRTGFKFKRDWQVMRCLKDDERQREANRDEIETDSLSQEPWNSFDKARLGTKALRVVLCQYLHEHILHTLPQLIKSLEGKISTVKSSLQELGPHRATREARMQYLIRISRQYGQLARDALSGDYSDSFFGKTEPGKRLRARTMALTDDFEHAMRTRGHIFEITSVRPSKSAADEPEHISMGDALDNVRKLVKGYRGPELPLLFNPRLVGELFKEQSQKWPRLAFEYTAATCHAVEIFLRKTVDSICPSPGRTSELILRDVFQDAIHDYHQKLDEKVLELFAPHTNLFLFSTRGRLQASLKAVQSQDELWPEVNHHPAFLFNEPQTPKSDQDTHMKALQLSRAYYNVALETFIDNVVVLGVESCMLSKLEEMFSPETVVQMKEEKLQLLGGEAPEIVAERTDLLGRLGTLEAALKNCRRHSTKEFGLDIGARSNKSQASFSGSMPTTFDRKRLSPSPRLAKVDVSLMPGNGLSLTQNHTKEEETLPTFNGTLEDPLPPTPKSDSKRLSPPVTDETSSRPGPTDLLTPQKVSQSPSPRATPEAVVNDTPLKSKSALLFGAPTPAKRASFLESPALTAPKVIPAAASAFGAKVTPATSSTFGAEAITTASSPFGTGGLFGSKPSRSSLGGLGGFGSATTSAEPKTNSSSGSAFSFGTATTTPEPRSTPSSGSELGGYGSQKARDTTAILDDMMIRLGLEKADMVRKESTSPRPSLAQDKSSGFGKPSFGE